MENQIEQKVKGAYFWAVLRIFLGWSFFWGFLDKVFGFGFGTPAGKSWLDGVSPTFGFLKFAVKGPLAGFYKSLAGNPIVDWMFMLGLCLVGLALLLGIGVKIAGYSGALIYILMYTAGFMPPERNPFLDEHIFNAVAMIAVASVGAGRYLGLGNWWSKTRLVQKFPILE